MKAVIFELDDVLICNEQAQPYIKERNWDEACKLISSFGVHDGIQDLLRCLRAAGVKIALVTGSPRQYCEKVTQHFFDPFDLTVCAEDTAKHKPHAEPFLKAIEHLRASPEDVITVGYLETDQVASRAAGLRSLTVDWHTQSFFSYEDYCCDINHLAKALFRDDDVDSGYLFGLQAEWQYDSGMNYLVDGDPGDTIADQVFYDFEELVKDDPIQIRDEECIANIWYRMGLEYEIGLHISRSDKRSAMCFFAAAELHHIKACFRLAKRYHLGIGIEQNYEKAAEWCKIAAEESEPEAEYLMGLLYENGNGVPEDLPTALFWYHRAAESKHRPSIKKVLEHEAIAQALNEDSDYDYNPKQPT